jgi:hypothetical protein
VLESLLGGLDTALDLQLAIDGLSTILSLTSGRPHQP